MASNTSYCNAAPATVVVTWHSCSVLWGFSASTLNSTENLKMYIRTSAFPRTREIKDLWKMLGWNRESRIMQLNTNPLANPAVNWLWLGPIPKWKESGIQILGLLGEKPSACELHRFCSPKKVVIFENIKEVLCTLFGLQQCAVAAIPAHRKPFFCQVTFAASVLRPAVGLTMH